MSSEPAFVELRSNPPAANRSVTISPARSNEPPDEPFTKILASAQTGEPWAFRWLFDAYAAPVTAFLSARGAHDPEGLANEAFLRAFQRVDTFAGDDSGFRAWIFTIARNLLIDERRRSDRRPHTIDLDDAVLTQEAGGDVEVEALDRFGADWLNQALEELSPDQRDVLLLRVVADLKINEVAEILGKRPGAVKALQRRGLAALKKKMQDEGVSQ
jgi:RNA polymerase sigma-70 factor (ECF subfamily)